MVDNESVLASFQDAALPKASDLVTDMPNWSRSDYRVRFRRLLDARWFAGMFLDGQSTMMMDHRRMRHDMDTGA